LSHFRFRLPCRQELTDIHHGDICQNAHFALEQPLRVEQDDVIELRDGAWFLIRAGFEDTNIEGKWTT